MKVDEIKSVAFHCHLRHGSNQHFLGAGLNLASLVRNSRRSYGNALLPVGVKQLVHTAQGLREVSNRLDGRSFRCSTRLHLGTKIITNTGQGKQRQGDQRETKRFHYDPSTWLTAPCPPRKPE